MINVWIDPFSEVYLGNKLFGYDKLLNRDDCLSHWRYLKNYCYERDTNLNTIDLWTEKKARDEDIYVTFNHKKRSIAGKVYSLIRNKSYQNSKTDFFKKKILFQFESPVVHPWVYKNIDDLTSIYDEVFLVCKVDNSKCHYFFHHQSCEGIIPEYWNNTNRSFF